MRILFIVLVAIIVPMAAHAQLTIFGNSKPVVAVDPDTNAVNLGVKFYSQVAGSISGIRFYRGHSNSNGYTVALYTAGGSKLASARVRTDTCAVPCWEQANFAAPISLNASTTYIAAYYTSNGRYAGDNYGLMNGAGQAPLYAQASTPSSGNGVYNYSTGFPNQTYKSSNYWVDVLFTPSNRTLMLNFNPPNPSLDDMSPLGTFITNAIASWSDGSQFTGIYALTNSDNGLCTISSTTGVITLTAAPPSNDATQNCTVSATQ